MNEYGRKSKGGLIGTILMFTLICTIAYLVISPGDDVQKTESQEEINVTPPKKSSEIPAQEIIPTVKPMPTFTPFISDIIVEKWNLSDCIGKTILEVNIIGAIIKGGQPPFMIKAHYQTNGASIPNRQAKPSNNSNVPNGMIIDPPLTVLTNKWITVTLTSNTGDGKPDWIDNLYFPPECR